MFDDQPDPDGSGDFKMRRVEVIDGLRGYFLVFMLLNHLTFEGGYALVRINHAELGFVQDAQGFVFLSGLLIGLIYAKKMARGGFRAGAAAIWRRAAELYAYAIGCIVAIVLLAQVLPYAGVYWDAWLGGVDGRHPAYRTAAAAFLYQPTFLDILPQYVVYMLAAPPLVWLCIRGQWLVVAIMSAVLWLCVQLGAHIPLANLIDSGLATWHEGLSLRVPFNVLAWQVVFMGGMVLGVLTAQNRIAWTEVFHPERTGALKLALAVLAFFLAWRLCFTFGVVPEVVTKRFQLFENRAEFGLVFLVNFVALAYALGWMLIAGPRSQDARAVRLASALHGLFSWGFLRLLGRHSLQVYAWHVLIVYAVKAVDWRFGPFDEIAKTAFALTALMLLTLPAILREVRQGRLVLVRNQAQ